MKVKQLIQELEKFDGECDLFVDVDSKLYPLELTRIGQFYKSVALGARVDFDIIRAEQTLLSCLQFQRDQLNGFVLDRIERAISKERTTRIIESFDEYQNKMKAEQEQMKPLIEEVQEALNSQETFVEETPKKKTRKSKKMPVEDTLGASKAILRRFYSGDKSDGLEAVKAAKLALGEEAATEIFNEVRNG